MPEIQIGFFDTGSTAGLNYYPTTSSFTEPTRLALVDDNDAATQIEISQTQNGALGVGTAVEAGISLPGFADELEGSYFFSDSGSVENWTFWNMPEGTHELIIFASRGATGPRSADFSFGSDTGSLDAAENTANTLTLTHTATEGEDVVFSFGRTSGSDFGYLNVAKLVLGEPVNSAEATIANGVLPPSGFDYVTLAGSLNFSNEGVIYNWGTEPETGDQIVFPDTITISPSGGIAGESGIYTCYAIDVSDAQPVLEGFTVQLGNVIPTGSILGPAYKKDHGTNVL